MIVFNKIFKKNTDQAKETTLYDVKDGQSVQVRHLSGEPADCERLREMGFCESAKVEKLNESGALICKICNSRVILSEGLARSIIVRPCEPEREERHEKSA